MRKEDALAICAELKGLLGDAPGKNDRALSKSYELLAKISIVESSDIGDVIDRYRERIKIWFSAKEWQKYGANQCKQNALNDLARIRMKIGETI